jgi:hypothetical protein
MKTLLTSIVSIAFALQASAAIIPFDLQGRSGLGMRFDNENPTASGSGTGGEILSGITFDNVSKILTLNVGWGSGKGFTDLTGTVTAAHIHQAANALFTTNGGVIVNLDGATPGFSNSASNGGWTNTTVTLSAAQETALLSGFLYLNAHTAANPGGEIRGNLVAVPEPSCIGVVGLALMGVASGGRMRRRKAIAA